MYKYFTRTITTMRFFKMSNKSSSDINKELREELKKSFALLAQIAENEAKKIQENITAAGQSAKDTAMLEVQRIYQESSKKAQEVSKDAIEKATQAIEQSMKSVHEQILKQAEENAKHAEAMANELASKVAKDASTEMTNIIKKAEKNKENIEKEIEASADRISKVVLPEAKKIYEEATKKAAEIAAAAMK